MNSTLLITSELTNQRARKALLTCVVYSNKLYLTSSEKCLKPSEVKKTKQNKTKQNKTKQKKRKKKKKRKP